MPNITNATLWDAIRDKYPQFASLTAKATKDTFTNEGWEAITTTQPTLVNEFFALSMRVYLQLINVSRAKDTLEEKGFGEYYDNPMGGIIQRIAIDSITPVSPAYKGLTNGSSVDPFVVRKPTQSERFFKRNFDYQSMITITDQYMLKDMFINPYGIDEFMSGIMTGLQNGYINQVYLNKLEVLNAAINSATHPLQATQKYDVTVTTPGDPTITECGNIIRLIKNIVGAMDLGPQTDAYNALKFKTTQDISRLKLLIRPGYKTAIETKLMAQAYHNEKLNIPIEVIEVPHFGGLVPQVDISGTMTDVYPQYDSLGAVKVVDDPSDAHYKQEVFNTAADGSGTDYYTEDVVYYDPNSSVMAVIADKGAVFTSKQNGYTVEPIRNPRGLYQNFFANSPKNTIAYDPLYNFVVINAV